LKSYIYSAIQIGKGVHGFNVGKVKIFQLCGTDSTISLLAGFAFQNIKENSENIQGRNDRKRTWETYLKKKREETTVNLYMWGRRRKVLINTSMIGFGATVKRTT